MNPDFYFYNTLVEIETNDLYDANFELFEAGATILRNRLNTANFEEFTDDEREVLEDIYTIINMGE